VALFEAMVFTQAGIFQGTAAWALIKYSSICNYEKNWEQTTAEHKKNAPGPQSGTHGYNGVYPMPWKKNPISSAAQ